MKTTRALTPRPALVLAAALSFLAVGCGGTASDGGSTIYRRLEGEPKTLDPLLMTSDPDNVVLALISRSLLDYDERLELVPGLAESITPDENYLVYTIKLRPGVTWEDGAPVTSEDVAFTIQAIVDPKTPSLTRRGFFEFLERVDVVDPLTSRAVFKVPYAGQRDAFNLPLLPARHYKGTSITSNPKNRAPLANGPYRLAAWESGRVIRLVRNPGYFGEKGAAAEFVFRVMPESASAFQGLRSGEIDESRLSAEQKGEIEATPGGPLRTLVYDELAFSYIAWNNRLPLFSDPRVRRALTMLIDRETIARTLYRGLAKPANGPVPPGLWSHDPSLSPWPHDPKRAAVLLDDAGWKLGKDGVRAKGRERFAFALSLGAGSQRQRQIVELVQQVLKGAGILLEIRPMEWGTFSAKVDAGDYEACMLALNLDPNPDLSPTWHSTQVPPNGMNHCFYRNPAADALMDELKTTFERGRAKELYAKLQRIVHEDEPVSFLHTVSVTWGVNKRLEGVKSSPIGLSLFWPGASAWRPVRGKKPV